MDKIIEKPKIGAESWGLAVRRHGHTGEPAHSDVFERVSFDMLEVVDLVETDLEDGRG